MKTGPEIGKEAREQLMGVLQRVPGLRFDNKRWVGREKGFPSSPEHGLDILVEEKDGTPWHLKVEVKSVGHPKQVRETIFWLDRDLGKPGIAENVYPIFIAPYVSSKAAQICMQEGIGYLDLSGNCHLSFGGIYIHVDGQENQFKDKRGLRSLYSPKAERVLRVLFGKPHHRWKVEEMAAEAEVSLGTVSNIRKLLAEQEWLDKDKQGFRLTDPANVLKNWRNQYDPGRSKMLHYYSIAGDIEIGSALQRLGIQQWAFTGLNAAGRYAFMVPSETLSIYIDGSPEKIAEQLGLKPTTSGGNVLIAQPYDEGVFYGKTSFRGEASISMVCPVQAYLDLKGLGGRSDEAAEFLYREVIEKTWLEN